MKQNKLLALLLFLLVHTVLTPLAGANMPMGPLAGLMKVSQWWLIPLVLAIEAVAIRLIFKLSWRRATTASIVVNLATAVIGFILYPVLAVVLYPLLGPFIIEVTGGGSLVEYNAVAVVVSFIDTVIKLSLIAILFKVGRSVKEAIAYLLVNIVTTAILFYPIIPAPELSPETRSKIEIFFSGNSTEYLIEAAHSGFIAGVEEAIAKGADVDAKVPSGETILIATLIKWRKLSDSRTYDKKRADAQYEIALLLIAQGADINAVGPKSETALQLFAENDDIDMVRALIRSGANVNVTGWTGPMASLLDSAKMANSEELVKVLEEAGAK